MTRLVRRVGLMVSLIDDVGRVVQSVLLNVIDIEILLCDAVITMLGVII